MTQYLPVHAILSAADDLTLDDLLDYLNDTRPGFGAQFRAEVQQVRLDTTRAAIFMSYLSAEDVKRLRASRWSPVAQGSWSSIMVALAYLLLHDPKRS